MPTLSKNQWMWMLLTTVIYSFLMGWPLAMTIVFTIAFHEYCHLCMAHRLGMRTQGFTMVPFIGGMSYVPYEGYKTHWRQAQVLLAGPIGSAAMGFLWFGIYLLTGVPFFAAAAFWMGIMNIFNLLPISFLDGGQIMNCISYSTNRKVGLYLMLGSTLLGTLGIVWAGSYIVGLFVLIFGLLHCRREYRNQKYARLGMTWMCTSDYLNKPFPLNENEIKKVFFIWLVSVITITLFCIYLSNLGFSSFALLLH